MIYNINRHNTNISTYIIHHHTSTHNIHADMTDELNIPTWSMPQVALGSHRRKSIESNGCRELGNLAKPEA